MAAGALSSRRWLTTLLLSFYLSEALLLHHHQRRGGAGGAVARRPPLPWAGSTRAPSAVKVDDDLLDELDDMTMNRPANVGRDKVKMWGVWLDSDVAGRKVLRRRLKDVEGDEQISDEDKAEVYFDEGLLLFQAGDYVPAAALMAGAVELVGAKSRRGGEFQLWGAQALHASGETREANEMLRRMKTHSDGAVRRVSQEILYIFEAPRLEIDPNELMQFDLEGLSGLEGFGQKKSLAMASATGKNGGYAKIEPGPDKYSLEWVKEQRLENPPPMDPSPLVAAAGLSVLFFAFAG
jgi:hypothetical protein